MSGLAISPSKVDIAQIGLLSAAVTELLKLSPGLRRNELTIALTSIFVTLIGVLVFNPADFSWSNFIPALLYSFASYKVIVQPVAKTAGLASQKDTK